VSEVRLASTGLIAVLQDGSEVAVGAGVTVKPAS
jgi:flagellar basal-body rod modification protein FlgD